MRGPVKLNEESFWLMSQIVGILAMNLQDTLGNDFLLRWAGVVRIFLASVARLRALSSVSAAKLVFLVGFFGVLIDTPFLLLLSARPPCFGIFFQ